jgi:hypothetical protein
VRFYKRILKHTQSKREGGEIKIVFTHSRIIIVMFQQKKMEKSTHIHTFMFKINKPDFFVLCEIVYHFQIDRNLAYLKKK